MKYRNPILPGFYPDPSICEANGEFYLVNSSFDYFPGIPLHHSSDLVNWKQLGNVLTRKSQLPLNRQRSYPVSQGIYAPTIRHHDGFFYVISTNMSSFKTFYTWTNQPEGDWSEIITIENFAGYDPSLYFDDDGTVYLTAAAIPWTSTTKEGIIQAKLDIETGQLLSDVKHIWGGSGYSTPEGPHLFKKDEWYYLIAAEGGTEFGHMQTISRSKSPFGPFENNPNNPIVSNRSTTLPIQATGHADMLKTNSGEWVAVLHGIRPLTNHKVHHLGRETVLVPVLWTDDNWPVLGNDGRVEIEHELKSDFKQKERESWTDEFNQSTLDIRWNTLKNLDNSSWNVNNGLNLFGNELNLNSSSKPPVFIGCRQQDKTCTISVELEFFPTQEGEEAGITVFMNENFHYDLYRTKLNGEQLLILRKQVGDITHIDKMMPISDPFVSLTVNAFNDGYEWYIQQKNMERQLVGSGEARLLAKEIAGGFTGVYFGMYASGNGRRSGTKAQFKNFSYSIKE